MSITRISLHIKAKHSGQRLARVLSDLLVDRSIATPEAAPNLARGLIDLGAVYVDRARMTSDASGLRLRAGAHLECYASPTLPKPAPALTDDDILFHDRALIAVRKPPGLPTQASRHNDRDHLFALVSRWLADRNHTYAGLHHRLDTDASGVVLFTTHRDANAPIATLFREHHVQRRYLAITAPAETENTWARNDALLKLKRGGVRAVPGGTPDAQPARTHFELLARHPTGCLVLATPETGRLHQIRAHLEASGLPILGDGRYGDRRSRRAAPRLMLHASQLSLPHPLSHEAIVIDCPPPDDFMRCLSRIEEAGA